MIRRAYLKKVEARFDEWSDEIAKLKEKAEEVQGDAKVLYKEQIEVLRSKQAVALERIRELQGAGVQSWGKFKSGTEAALNDLKKAVDDAIAKIRKSA